MTQITICPLDEVIPSINTLYYWTANKFWPLNPSTSTAGQHRQGRPCTSSVRLRTTMPEQQLNRSTRPTALNSYDRRGHGAQHSRSTRGMMLQDPMPTGSAGRSSLQRNVLSITFPAAARRNPLTRCNSNGQLELHLAFWRLRARRRSLIPGFEIGIQVFMVFSAQTCYLPALNASARTTSRTASWSRKLSSAIVQTTSRTMIMKVRKSTLAAIWTVS